MNERYFILKRGAFVNDGKKLQKRDEPISRELLELENEIETLENLLKMTQIEYERYRTLESPEISKKRASKICKKALLVNMLIGNLSSKTIISIQLNRITWINQRCICRIIDIWYRFNWFYILDVQRNDK